MPWNEVIKMKKENIQQIYDKILGSNVLDDQEISLLIDALNLLDATENKKIEVKKEEERPLFRIGEDGSMIIYQGHPSIDRKRNPI